MSHDLLDDLRTLDPCRDQAPDAARLDARVDAALAREPRRRPDRAPALAARRRRRWPAAVLACAAAALAAAVALTGSGGGGDALGPAPASAAVVLERLAARADAGAGEQTGRYAYRRTVNYVSHMRPVPGGEGTYVVLIPHDVEEWVDARGRGVAHARVREDEARYPTPADREAAERAPAGPPWPDAPVAIEEWKVAGLTVDDIRALPADPAALRARLDGLKVRRIPAAGQLLSYPALPDPVRRALFALLRDEPGARVDPEVRDPRGRTGVGVTFEDAAWRTTFVFDQGTGALLATRSIGKREVPGREIEDWTLVLETGRRASAPDAVTPSRPARPAG